jgi:hypothetical protein
MNLSAKEQARIRAIIAKHEATIEWCSQQLATNFDVSANVTIGIACYRIGISRMEWEKLCAVKNGWDFHRPPKHVIARWEVS